MHLISRDTVLLCIHTLRVERDHYIKAGTKTFDSKGKETDGPIIRIERALEELIRYDASITLFQSFLPVEEE